MRFINWYIISMFKLYNSKVAIWYFYNHLYPKMFIKNMKIFRNIPEYGYVEFFIVLKLQVLFCTTNSYKPYCPRFGNNSQTILLKNKIWETLK